MIRLETNYRLERDELDRFKEFIARKGFRVSNRFHVGAVFVDETASLEPRDPWKLIDSIHVAYLDDRPQYNPARLRVKGSDIPGADAFDRIIQEYIAQTKTAPLPEKSQLKGSPSA